MAEKPTKNDRRGIAKLAAHELVALAAYFAGADRRRTDTEDIAVKANEISPGRFTWRKYRDQISLEDVYKHLWDLTKPDKGAYIKGSKKVGWLLTDSGIAFAEKNADRTGRADVREKRPRQEEKWMKRERARMLGEPTYLKLREGRKAEVTAAEAERFFRIDDYVVGEARRQRIERVVAAFRDDLDLASTVNTLAKLIPEK